MVAVVSGASKPARDAAAGPVEPSAAGAKAVPITWAAVINMIVWVWGSWGKPGSLGLHAQTGQLRERCMMHAKDVLCSN